ncbi:MAG: hypothetical protein V4543_04945 [Bacteroidota bacterium]
MRTIARYALYAFFPALLMTGCNSDPTEECKQLQQENAILREATQSRDQQIDEVTKAMNDVENNLAGIEQNQTALGDLKGDRKAASQKEKIQTHIDGIRAYIKDNQEKISQLEDKYNKSKSKSASMQRLIARLRHTIKRKEAEIDSLFTANNLLTTRVGELEGAVSERDAQIADKSSQLENKTNEAKQLETEKYTGWYVSGSAKQLEEWKVIERKGGILGLGKTGKVQPNADLTKFKSVDQRTTTEVDLGETKKFTLLTTHPTESWTWAQNGKRQSLRITDPTKFWSVSKYLVVQTNN